MTHSPWNSSCRFFSTEGGNDGQQRIPWNFPVPRHTVGRKGPDQGAGTCRSRRSPDPQGSPRPHASFTRRPNCRKNNGPSTSLSGVILCRHASRRGWKCRGSPSVRPCRRRSSWMLKGSAHLKTFSGALGRYCPSPRRQERGYSKHEEKSPYCRGPRGWDWK